MHPAPRLCFLIIISHGKERELCRQMTDSNGLESMRGSRQGSNQVVIGVMSQIDKGVSLKEHPLSNLQ